MKLRKNIIIIFIFFIILIIIQFINIYSIGNSDIFESYNRIDTLKASNKESKLLVKFNNIEKSDSNFFFFNSNKIEANIIFLDSLDIDSLYCLWFYNDSLLKLSKRKVYNNVILKETLPLKKYKINANGKIILFVLDKDSNYLVSESALYIIQ